MCEGPYFSNGTMQIQCNFQCWISTDAFLRHRPAETLGVSQHICLLLSDGRV